MLFSGLGLLIGFRLSSISVSIRTCAKQGDISNDTASH